jgi:hypothetical protein
VPIGIKEYRMTALKIKKAPPHSFVLDALERLAPTTRHMFGCLAVYVGEKIVLVLREKEDYPEDNGVWLGTTHEHHASLKREFPSMRSIGFLGEGGPTGWQNLPSEDPGFEEQALHSCELVLRGDPRIGKVPKARKKKLPRKAAVTRAKRPIPAKRPAAKASTRRAGARRAKGPKGSKRS